MEIGEIHRIYTVEPIEDPIPRVTPVEPDEPGRVDVPEVAQPPVIAP